MVAYSFQARFVPRILAGTKRHTLRYVGLRRHARVGDALQLYFGMRTKQCRLVARAQCVAHDDIALVFDATAYSKSEGVRSPHGIAAYGCTTLDDFAVGDGFNDWGEFRHYWRQVLGPDRFVWSGRITVWGGLEPCLSLEDPLRLIGIAEASA